MKKTLTAALALSTFAGLALATSIETPKAGFLTVDGPTSGETLVCSPFESFEGTATLGDIVGTSGASICVVSSGAKRLFTASWDTEKKGWFPTGSSVSSNDFPLARGTSVLFSGSSASLMFSGNLAASANVTNDLAAGEYAPVGNVSAATTGKKLGDFSLIGCDPAKDYVVISGTKYVYYSGHWYTREAFLSSSFTSNVDETVDIPYCGGIAVICAGNPKRGAARTGLKVALPGIY
jgi:hypothetical protein